VNPADTIRARLRSDLSQALKARDGETATVLRTLIAAVDNAEAVSATSGDPYRELAFGDPAAEVPRKALSAAEIAALLDAEIAERQAVADELATKGGNAQADELRAGCAIVRRYLP
jgi:uncharacterized protein YqeY